MLVNSPGNTHPSPLIFMPAHSIHDASLSARSRNASALLPIISESVQEAESHTPTRLSCHICGATTSRRGRLFGTRADLLRHLRSSHRDVPLGPIGEISPALPPNPPSDPALSRPPAAAPRKKASDSTVHAKFCPSCGCNLSVINAALSFAAEHESI